LWILGVTHELNNTKNNTKNEIDFCIMSFFKLYQNYKKEGLVLYQRKYFSTEKD
jgi:hypothetical protein